MKLYKEARTEMTNSILFEEFKKISQHDNPFDCITALKKFKKEYKTSVFYKKTHLNIYKAYELFNKIAISSLAVRINELLQSDNLAVYLNDIMSEINISTVINQFLDGINYDFLFDTIRKFIPDITVNDLNDIIEQLQQAVANFKK